MAAKAQRSTAVGQRLEAQSDSLGTQVSQMSLPRHLPLVAECRLAIHLGLPRCCDLTGKCCFETAPHMRTRVMEARGAWPKVKSCLVCHLVAHPCPARRFGSRSRCYGRNAVRAKMLARELALLWPRAGCRSPFQGSGLAGAGSSIAQAPTLEDPGEVRPCPVHDLRPAHAKNIAQRFRHAQRPLRLGSLLSEWQGVTPRVPTDSVWHSSPVKLLLTPSMARVDLQFEARSIEAGSSWPPEKSVAVQAAWARLIGLPSPVRRQEPKQNCCRGVWE